MKMVKLLLIGDSDIAYWPRHLLPCSHAMNPASDVILLGHSGATLEDVVTMLQREMDNIQTSISKVGEGGAIEKLVVVACAGENDIGNGLLLDSSVSALNACLDQIFQIESTAASCEQKNCILSVIFLGPKFEPWLNSDASSKKKYSKLSRSFSRCCNRHFHSDRIHYVDCLTAFCGDSANVPGAVLGGKAIAQTKYFAPDQLHLNDDGYTIWKGVIETLLQTLAT
jgi:lysophospholipase L1-like esterase